MRHVRYINMWDKCIRIFVYTLCLHKRMHEGRSIKHFSLKCSPVAF